MPVYEFECRACRERFTRLMHHQDYTEPPCPLCGDATDQVFDKGNGGFTLGMTPGKRSGFYDYDYGKKATWDLTAPGKMEQLKKAGVIRDPFDEVPKRSNPDVIDW